MAGPRTATKILEMRGAFKAHPERKRPQEPISHLAFPVDPPANLKPAQQAVWKEIVSVVPAGVLTGSDIFPVEVAAVLLTEFRRIGVKMYPGLLTRMVTELGKLGLSPSDRAKLRVERPKAGKYDDI